MYYCTQEKKRPKNGLIYGLFEPSLQSRSTRPVAENGLSMVPETSDARKRGAGGIRATVETTWTFGPSGSPAVEYGCHLAGHWTYGMHGKALIR